MSLSSMGSEPHFLPVGRPMVIIAKDTTIMFYPVRKTEFRTPNSIISEAKPLECASLLAPSTKTIKHLKAAARKPSQNSILILDSLPKPPKGAPANSQG
jgi:hypothetical protein